MRWRSIRSQLLLPLLLLLAGVLALSVWMAFAAARQARQQIEMRVRDVAHIVREGGERRLADAASGTATPRRRRYLFMQRHPSASRRQFRRYIIHFLPGKTMARRFMAGDGAVSSPGRICGSSLASVGHRTGTRSEPKTRRTGTADAADRWR